MLKGVRGSRNRSWCLAAVAAAARDEGARVFGPSTQKNFLEALGIRLRAEKLKAGSPASAADIDTALDRLTNPKQMGALFKVLAIADERTIQLPGFTG